MGEPLDNYDNVVAAIDILAQGLELSRSKIIVSTVRACANACGCVLAWTRRRVFSGRQRRSGVLDINAASCETKM
jgi:hypothetical protein